MLQQRDLKALDELTHQMTGTPAILTALVKGQADRAVELAQQGVIDEDSAEAYAELACAFLFRARTANIPEDLAWALEASDQALKRDPKCLAAVYNRALALELFHLHLYALSSIEMGQVAAPAAQLELQALRARLKRAIASREQPSANDFNQALGDRGRLGALFARFPQEGREWAEGQCVETWAADIAAGRPAPTAALTLVSELLIEQGRDNTLGQHLERHRALLPREQRLLAKAVLDFGEAERAYKIQDLERSRVCLARALPVFERYGSAFRFLAYYRQAVCDYHKGQNRYVIQELDRLLAGVSEKNLPALRAKLFWLRHLAQSRLGAVDRGLEDLEAARRLFVQLGERGNLGAILTMIALERDSLGELDRAWQARLEALAQLPVMDARRRVNLLTSCSSGLNRLGANGVALMLAQVALGEADQSANALLQAIAITKHASILLDGEKIDAADADLALAKRAAARIPDPATREGVMRDIGLVAVTVASRRDPAAALSLLDELERICLKRESEHLLMQIFEARARSLLALGRESEAESTFSRGAEVFSDVRSRLVLREHRIAFQEDAARFFDLWIGLRGPTAAGLAIVERYRSLTLADQLEGQNLPSLAELQARMSPHEQALVYHQRERTLFGWLVRHDRIEGHELPISRKELERRLVSWQRTLRAGRGGDETRAEGFYDLLVAPLMKRSELGQRLVIVPHEQLWRLPFGFLMDRRNEQRLVERHSLICVPSLLAYQRGLDYQRSSKPLLVALAQADGSAFQLDQLQASEAEARAVAATFDGEVLVGKQVRPATFLDALTRADILHFAGHAINTREGGGQLILAANADDDGRLGFEQLALAKRSPELVVLAACSTASGRLRQSERPQALAMAFLAQGTAEVLGSLWPVDDRQSYDLFLDFYTFYRAGEQAPEALRQAILRQLNRDTLTTLGTLAAFQVWG